MLFNSSSSKEPIGTQSRKIKICKALIRPVTTYRAESWTVNKDIAKWLAAFERKVSRRMPGGVTVMKIGERNRIKNYCSCMDI
jgi:hypothetical protein